MIKHIYALHGWTGCGADFDLLKTSFDENEFKWTCPDLLTEKYLTPEFNEMLLLLKAEFEALPDNEERILLGYSMGGRLALHLAKIINWKKDDRFICISATPGMRIESERSLKCFTDNVVAEEVLNTSSATVFFEKWLENPLISNQKTMPNEWFEKLLKNRAAGDLKMWAKALQKWSPGVIPSVWQDLQKISEDVKTLLICGEEDEKYFEIMAEMKNNMPTALFKPVRRSNHSPQFENPEKCARIIQGL